MPFLCERDFLGLGDKVWEVYHENVACTNMNVAIAGTGTTLPISSNYSLGTFSNFADSMAVRYGTSVTSVFPSSAAYIRRAIKPTLTMDVTAKTKKFVNTSASIETVQNLLPEPRVMERIEQRGPRVVVKVTKAYKNNVGWNLRGEPHDAKGDFMVEAIATTALIEKWRVLVVGLVYLLMRAIGKIEKGKQTKTESPNTRGVGLAEYERGKSLVEQGLRSYHLFFWNPGSGINLTRDELLKKESLKLSGIVEMLVYVYADNDPFALAQYPRPAQGQAPPLAQGQAPPPAQGQAPRPPQIYPVYRCGETYGQASGGVEKIGALHWIFLENVSRTSAINSV